MTDRPDELGTRRAVPPKGRRVVHADDGLVENIRHFLTSFGAYAAHPSAFLLVAIYALVWWVANPATFEWHASATIRTLIIALLIQRSTHRDTQALHAKLDELLRSVPAARTELARVDDAEPEDIEQYRKKKLREPPIG